MGTVVVAVLLPWAIAVQGCRGGATGRGAEPNADTGAGRLSGAVVVLHADDDAAAVDDARAEVARQRRSVGQAVSFEEAPAGVEPVTSLPPRAWFVIFGGAAELISITRETHPKFPGARVLTMRPAGGGEKMSILVPADYMPMVLWRS